MLTVPVLAAATNNDVVLFVLGALLGALLLGLGELSFLGYLKLRELLRAWRAQLPDTTPPDDKAPWPAVRSLERRAPVVHKPHLRPVTASAPAARNGSGALRRHAVYDPGDLPE